VLSNERTLSFYQSVYGYHFLHRWPSLLVSPSISMLISKSISNQVSTILLTLLSNTLLSRPNLLFPSAPGFFALAIILLSLYFASRSSLRRSASSLLWVAIAVSLAYGSGFCGRSRFGLDFLMA
jgi:hypothetical protein